MEEKINIAELLKDCPKGMELDCTMYNKVTLLSVDNSEDTLFPIKVLREDGCSISLTKYGQYADADFAKCIIFPKGKNTWEGFQRPFKDGDVVVCEVVKVTQMFIVQSAYSEGKGKCYFGYDFERNRFFEEGIWRWDRLASEEEKQKLFQAIKDNGYRWNAETKTLEKLPRFKVGDRIKDKNNKIWFVVQVSDKHFDISLIPNAEGYFVPIEDQDNYEFVPDKFDISTLKPFDNCKYSLDGGKTWKFAQYWYIQDKYDINEIEIDLWLN